MGIDQYRMSGSGLYLLADWAHDWVYIWAALLLLGAAGENVMVEVVSDEVIAYYNVVGDGHLSGWQGRHMAVTILKEKQRHTTMSHNLLHTFQ